MPNSGSLTLRLILVPPYPLRGPMVSAPVSRSSRPPRIVILLCLLVVLGFTILTFSRFEDDHWNEVGRARLLLDRGQPDMALQAVSRIRDDRPGAAEGLTVAARALLMRGSIASARRTLERSLSMKLDQPEAAKMLAAIYLSAGDGKRGVVLLKKAAELEPADFRPWYAMGKVYHDLGNLQESVEAYSQALRRSPPAVEAKESRIGRVRAAGQQAGGASLRRSRHSWEGRTRGPASARLGRQASPCLGAARMKQRNWPTAPWRGIPESSTPCWFGLAFISSPTSQDLQSPTWSRPGRPGPTTSQRCNSSCSCRAAWA